MARKKQVPDDEILPEALIYEEELKRIRKMQTKKKEKQHWYVRFCRWANKTAPSLGKDAKFKEEYREALDFLEWDITASELAAGTKIIVYPGMILGVVLAYYVYMIMQIDYSIKIYLAGACIVLPLLVSVLIQNYPLSQAKTERLISMTFIPEIINYLTMSMKLSPNLERAVAFAVEHGRGRLAREMKKALWQTNVGVYKTIEEALDELAYRWGKWSEEFKHAMMLIRGSVLESDEGKRAATLDKAVSDVLQGIKEKMDIYVRSMHQPSVFLYYFGVLLPLMLVIIVPVGSMIACLPLAKANILAGVYNLAIPTVAFLYARSIVKKRPPTYIAPKIPDKYPGLPKKGNMRLGNSEIPVVFPALAALLIPVLVGYVLNIMFVENIPSYVQTDRTPYYLIFGPLVGITFAISTYLYLSATYKRKIQTELMKMEQEFQDAMYVVASRLAENRPIEEAFVHVSEFIPESRVGKDVFKKSVDNVSVLGLTLESAVFHPVYGSLRQMPSRLITGMMRIVLDSVQLGVQTAAQSLISLSSQLRDSQKVNEHIKKMLEDVTMMMKTMVLLITPLVLGISVALQKIVISSLGSLSGTSGLTGTNIQTTGSSAAFGGFSTGGFGGMGSMLGCSEILQDAITPASFVAIIGLFVLEIGLVLLYFCAQIDEGNNELAFPMYVSRILPISMILFCGAVMLAGRMVGT